LAGGVAHDFNNLLTVILGYTDMLVNGTPPLDAEALASLREVSKAGMRAQALTGQLLAFGRKQVLETRQIDINVVISDLGKMVRRLIGEDIAVETRLRTNLGTILADASQIGQIMMNLAVNARDAMPNGGSLIIETTNLHLDAEAARHFSDLQPGPYVKISVTDTGAGIPVETQKRIFEPFFTTKPKGKGTGLGLSTVYGIVKQHSGDITVQSNPGAGTTFSIYLPQTLGEIPQQVNTEMKCVPGTQMTATVLVVEDDVTLRKLVCCMLKAIGYQSITAKNGRDAISIISQNDNIDLLLTDIIMPKMNGTELADRVQAIRPELKVLFMSGYTENVLSQRGKINQQINFLRKPFTVNSLHHKIRETLDMLPIRVASDSQAPTKKRRTKNYAART
jgi:two-component system, cell cycle sensor histidine kinase and response regulator CckA